MKKLLLTLAISVLSIYCTLSQDTEYKFNSRTGKFDMVRTSSWLLSNLPDSISALSGDIGYIPYFQTANKIISSPLYYNGVNVGLGKTNPSYKLDVNGSANALYYLLNGVSLKKSIDTVSTSLTTGLLKVTNGTGKLTTAVAGTDYQTPLINPVTGTGTSGYVAYWNGISTVAGNGNLVWDNANARLGIGMTPSYSLDVSGNIRATTGMYASESHANNFMSRYNTDATVSIYPQNTTSSYIRFGVGNNNTTFTTEWARFQNGNLGVGTTSPNYKLDANGSVNALYYLLNGTSLKKTIDTVSTSLSTGLLKVTNGTGKLTTAIAGTDYQSPITNPVTGTGTSSYVAYWNGTSALSGNSNLIWDNSNGRLGIGKTPSSTLDVNGNIQASSTVVSLASQSNSYMSLYSTGAAISIFPQNTTNPYVRFGVGNNNTTFTTEWARFQNGNLGVGTTSPNYKLDVSGDINTTGGIYINGVRKDTGWDSASGVSDGDKGDVIVSSSGTVWEVDASTVVKLSGNQTIAGIKTFSSTITGSISGSAGQVANTLTRGSYLTGNNFNGSASTTWAVDATSTNTASKVVARDASGDFSAGAITADTRLESKSIVSPYREVAPSAGVVSVDCSSGTEVYSPVSGNFTLNLSNVRNGQSGDIVVNSSATFTVTFGTFNTYQGNALTKKSSGVFSSLSAGIYYITWNAIDLGSGKRFISFNIGFYN